MQGRKWDFHLVCLDSFLFMLVMWNTVLFFVCQVLMLVRFMWWSLTHLTSDSYNNLWVISPELIFPKENYYSLIFLIWLPYSIFNSLFNTSELLCEISFVWQRGRCHANIPSMTPQRLGNVWLILICSQISDCVFESHGIARRRYDLIMMRKSHRFYTFPFRILLLWMKWC